MQLQIHLLEDRSKLLIYFCDLVMELFKLLRDFYWSFKFKFKFKFKLKCFIQLVTMFYVVCFSGVNSTSDNVQSFERVASMVYVD